MKVIYCLLALSMITPRVLAISSGLYDISDALNPKLIKDQVGQVTIVSISNDNKRYNLTLHALDHFSLPCSQIGLIVGNQTIRFNSQGMDGQNHFTSIETQINDVETASQIARLFHINVEKRHHPQNEMLVEFIPDHEEFEAGKPVIIKFRLTNIGSNNFAFIQGGRQRGARDNQFAFTAEAFGNGDKMLPDTGDPRNSGGLGVPVTLKPGQSHEINVNLDRWFHFEKGEYYNVRGSYYMEFIDPETHELDTIWEDYAGGEFMIEMKN